MYSLACHRRSDFKAGCTMLATLLSCDLASPRDKFKASEEVELLREPRGSKVRCWLQAVSSRAFLFFQTRQKMRSSSDRDRSLGPQGSGTET